MVRTNSPALHRTPLTSRATINYLLLTRSIRQSSAGRRALNLHVRNRPGPQLYTLTPDRNLSCDLCAVPAKTYPPRHFQGWSLQSHGTFQYHPHQPQVQKNQLHGLCGPAYPPRTGHLQGCIKQLTQRPSLGAHAHKLPIGPTKVSSQVHSKVCHTRPRQNFQPIATVPTTAQAPHVCTHLEHRLRQ